MKQGPLLALGAIVFTSTAIGAPKGGQGALPPAEDLDLARTLLQELVEMRTTHDVGTTQAAQAIREHLVTAGFPESDVVFIAPPDHPNSGNVIVRYRGWGKLKPVLFLGHLDVVEARREDWSVDPFKLTEQDGWFYGRGTRDMKAGAAALIESLIRLRREKFTPERDIIVALTADEEAGGDANGPEYLLKNRRELIDAELAINLDGGGGTYKSGKRMYFSLGTSEKVYVTYTLETTSPGGHGSMPGPDNAIYRLADGLKRIEAYKFPVTLTATTRASLAKMADIDPGPLSTDMRAVAKEPADLAAAERLSETVRLNAQLRTTCVATLVSGGHAENALPQRAKATIQCRMIPGDSADNVKAALVAAVADAKISVTMDTPPIASPESPPTPEIMRRAEKIVHSMWPGVPIVPTMANGFTDGRQTRSAGIPTYDLGGIWMEMGENRSHGRDERIGVREFDESVEYTYRLVKAMGGRK